MGTHQSNQPQSNEPQSNQHQSNELSSIAALIERRSPACGSTKIVAVDGPNGAGKSTLASVLADELSAPVLAMTGIYRGVHGLFDGIDVLVDDVLKPIAIGEPGRHREWNWARQAPGAVVDTPAAPVLIVDGAGSGARRARIFSSVVVWVDADEHLRYRRALQRDGAELERWWEAWTRQEQEYFAAEHPEAIADLRILTQPVA